LTPYEQSVVENRMASLNYGGVEYKLVGASGSAKDGKFYFVDQAHAGQIAERFQHWPEAAIVYFAILVPVFGRYRSRRMDLYRAWASLNLKSTWTRIWPTSFRLAMEESFSSPSYSACFFSSLAKLQR
jgi:hypothetical protein